MKNKAKWMAFLLAAGMLLNTMAVSAQTVTESGEGASVTETEISDQEEFEDKSDFSEYKFYDNQEMNLIKKGEGTLLKGSKNITWTIAPKGIFASGSFWCKKGGSIAIVGGATPTDKTIYVGIIKPSGVKNFFYAKNAFSHSFAVEYSGFYQVYARNENSVTVTTSISAYY